MPRLRCDARRRRLKVSGIQADLLSPPSPLSLPLSHYCSVFLSLFSLFLPVSCDDRDCTLLLLQRAPRRVKLPGTRPSRRSTRADHPGILSFRTNQREAGRDSIRSSFSPIASIKRMCICVYVCVRACVCVQLAFPREKCLPRSFSVALSVSLIPQRERETRRIRGQSLSSRSFSLRTIFSARSARFS